MKRRLFYVLIAFATLAPLVPLGPGATPPVLAEQRASVSAEPTLVADFARLPLSIVLNVGQTDPAVRFLAQVAAGTIFFAPSEVIVALGATYPARPEVAQLQEATDRATTSIVRLRFAGANPAVDPIAEDGLPGTANYLLGDDPARWHTNVATYAAISYRQLYPGIDLRYDGTRDSLKGSYTVAPGADPRQIRWRYEGTNGVSLDERGNLVVSLSSTGTQRMDGSEPMSPTLTESAPLAWQEVDGQRVPVAVDYVVAADGSVGFNVGAYDLNRPLIIDPRLVYSTWLGGSAGGGLQGGTGIAVDAVGNAYVVGFTGSPAFPTVNPIQGTVEGSIPKAFVAKLNAAGTALVYSTYLGGSGSDEAHGIAVDSGGNAYVTGSTFSLDFPATNPLHTPLITHNSNAFVAKLSPAGNSLVYSIYLGGSHTDKGQGIAVDEVGNAYVTGWTTSNDFPTVNAFLSSARVDRYPITAFVAKLNPAGDALVYSTYLGEEGSSAYGVAVDRSGSAYVTGSTGSDLPTVNPLQAHFGGFSDAFVAKLNPAGNGLVYSTYLGGHYADTGIAVAVDGDGNAYVTGKANGYRSGQPPGPGDPPSDFPLVNAVQGTFGGGDGDAFVAKLNPTGRALVLSTYLGGNGSDGGSAIAVDKAGNVYIAGATASVNFPLANPIQAVFGGGFGDAFVARLNPAGDSLVFSTYLGGSAGEGASGVAVDGSGNAFVVGGTSSSDFPTVRSIQPNSSGADHGDAFIAKIDTVGSLPAPHDNRYFAQTGFRIDNDVIWDYFNKRGGIQTFGYPVSRAFTLQGFTTQVFQRRIVQLDAQGHARLLNLLDQGLMPYASINNATLPSIEGNLAALAPNPVDSVSVLNFVRDHAPDSFIGKPVNFYQTFLNTVSLATAFPRGGGDPSLLPGLNLEMWGIPTSAPFVDPNNANFVYLRFQRGIMHYDAGCNCTQGILLADYFKSILTGVNLPADLGSEARSSPYYRQYDRDAPNWVRNPTLLPSTNLTNAFEAQ